jgi:hypothetical protein
MSQEAPKKIPAWVRNLRAQIYALDSGGLIRVPDSKLQWQETELVINPFEAFLMVNTVSESLMVRMYFGSVSDTSEVDSMFDENPFLPAFEVIYDLEPIAPLWILRELYVSATTTKEEIYNFLKECTLISVVGLQSLIFSEKLVEPSKEILAEYGLDTGQRNWGNTWISAEILSGTGF